MNTLEDTILESIWDIFNQGKSSEEEFMLTFSQEEKIKDIIQSYADTKCKKLAESGPEEMWDEYSEYIDDDIDALSKFAGSSVVTRANFIKAINSLK